MIENGSKNANTEALWRIASALDMRMSELMRLVEDSRCGDPPSFCWSRSQPAGGRFYADLVRTHMEFGTVSANQCPSLAARPAG